MSTSVAPAVWEYKAFANKVQFPLCIATAASCISFSGFWHRVEGLASTNEYLG